MKRRNKYEYLPVIGLPTLLKQLFLVGVVAASCVIPSPVIGQDVAEANKRGKKLFTEGKVEEATDVWRSAVLDACGAEELNLAKNLGIAYYQLGKLPEATLFFYYAQAVDSFGVTRLLKAHKVSEALKDLQKTLDKTHGRLEVRTSPSPNARICWQRKGRTDTDCAKTPLITYLLPGDYTVTVERQGMVTAGRLVTITGKTRKRLHVTLEPLSSLNEFLLIPERVTGGAGGVFHTCVRLSSGRINCWGDNRGGQVGDGSCDWYQLSPATRVIELSKVSQLSAGGSHTCAVNTGGKVICWGRAADGQLGDGCGGPDCQDGYRPVEVNLPSRATSVALGFEHSCSLLDSGQVYCWGQNYSGQLGSGKDASEMPFTNLPIAVQGLSGKAVEVVAGGYHTCARLEDAKVYCWGDNRYGQLGDGTDIEQLTPTVPVEIHQQATGLAAGGYHSCATLEDASLHCWGRNKSGQLGDGTQIDRFRPVHVAGLKGKPATVALGQSHSCVLQTGGGRVDCWGSNAIGQLGLGTFTDSPTPRRVKGVGGVLAQLFTGGHHTCAVLQEDGSIRCWGQNFYGQLGDGNRRDRNKP